MPTLSSSRLSTRPRHAVGELEQLAGHGLVEAVHAGDAVAHRQDGAGLLDGELGLVALDLLADDAADLVGSDFHGAARAVRRAAGLSWDRWGDGVAEKPEASRGERCEGCLAGLRRRQTTQLADLGDDAADELGVDGGLEEEDGLAGGALERRLDSC